jgi:4'-phosphopantetheinyl transferase
MHSALLDFPSGALMLDSDEVHVWRVDLAVSASDVESLGQILSDDERARAVRFCFQKDGKNFTVARGILRILLGRYLTLEPSRVEFSYGPHGRPALAVQNGSQELCFNISHSDGLALYAFTRNREIGIDLERIRPEMANDQIAERFFAPQEINALRALPSDRQLEAFFHCWTRKEAFVKAKGEGLSIPLDEFAVSLTPGEPAAIISIKGDAETASLWSLQALTPGAGYVAALAVKGHGWRLTFLQWPAISATRS